MKMAVKKKKKEKVWSNHEMIAIDWPGAAANKPPDDRRTRGRDGRRIKVGAVVAAGLSGLGGQLFAKALRPPLPPLLLLLGRAPTEDVDHSLVAMRDDNVAVRRPVQARHATLGPCGKPNKTKGVCR